VRRFEIGDRGRKSEVGDQRSEVRGRRSEVGGQRSEVRDQRSEVRYLCISRSGIRNPGSCQLPAVCCRPSSVLCRLALCSMPHALSPRTTDILSVLFVVKYQSPETLCPLDHCFILIVSGTFSSPALVLSVLMVRVSCNSNLPAGSLSTDGVTSN
jgi:hypothetical protein